MLSAGLLLALPAWAASGEVRSLLSEAQERRAAVLYTQLQCPVCEAQALGESHSFLAEEMKASIREMLLAGMSNDEIIGYFVDRYGEWILLEPPRRGWGLWAWLMPGFGVVGVSIWLLAWIRSRAHLRDSEGDLETELSDEERERIRALVLD